MADELTTIERSELEQYEAVIERTLFNIQEGFREIGRELSKIQKAGLYKDYGTWETYTERRWNMSDENARRLMRAAETYENLEATPPLGGLLPEYERQIRPLTLLKEPEQQREAWQLAVESAANGIVTRRHVEAAVEAIKRVEQASSFDYKRDTKAQRTANEYVPQGYDACQTPPYAVDPLLPYVNAEWTIWEPAQGEGLLVEAFYDSGFGTVEGSDLLTGQNFFEYEPSQWDCIVTNPPFSLKYKWLERCYQLGKPFALLVPVEMLGAKTAQELMKEYGFEVMLLNRRISFKMPNKGWEGAGAQFPTMWLCWRLLPETVMFGEISSGGLYE